MARFGARETLLTFLMVIAVFLLPFLWMVGPYLLAFFMGAILAVLSHPLYLRLVARGLRPGWASLIVTLVLVLGVMGPLAAFVVSAIQQGVEATSALAAKGPEALGTWLDRAVAWGPLARLGPDPQELRQQIQQGLVLLAREAGNVAFGVLARVPNALLEGTICGLTVYFLHLDGRRFFEWVAGKLPLPDQIRESLATSFQRAARAVVFASMASIGAQAGILLVAFLALEIPGAFLWAFTAFILGWIPTFGSVPVTLGGMLWLYSEGDIARMFVLLGVGVLVGVVDNVIRPWVLRGNEEMHPLLSLLAILGGIGAFGLVGAFVGPLLAAMVTAVLSTWPTVAAHCRIPIAENGRLPDVPLPESAPPGDAPPVQ